jgi:hypothetical protein
MEMGALLLADFGRGDRSGPDLVKLSIGGKKVNKTTCLFVLNYLRSKTADYNSSAFTRLLVGPRSPVPPNTWVI